MNTRKGANGELFLDNRISQKAGKVNTNSEKNDKSFALPDDDVSQSLREAEKKRNFGYSEGQEAKAEANENAKKVYTRKDASRVVSSVMAETMNFGEVYGNLVGGSREQVVEMLWKALNSAPAGERVGVALKIAEYTIDFLVVKCVPGYRGKENIRCAKPRKTEKTEFLIKTKEKIIFTIDKIDSFMVQ